MVIKIETFPTDFKDVDGNYLWEYKLNVNGKDTPGFGLVTEIAELVNKISRENDLGRLFVKGY